MGVRPRRRKIFRNPEKPKTVIVLTKPCRKYKRNNSNGTKPSLALILLMNNVRLIELQKPLIAKVCTQSSVTGF